VTKIRLDLIDPKVEELLIGGKKEVETIQALLNIPRLSSKNKPTPLEWVFSYS
jgi:hypothetical protein